MADGPERNGAIFRADSTHAFAADTLVRASGGRNLLLVLGFDVYTQPVAHTARVRSEQGIDLARVHRDEFAGRPVYVVGALPGVVAEVPPAQARAARSSWAPSAPASATGASQA